MAFAVAGIASYVFGAMLIAGGAIGVAVSGFLYTTQPIYMQEKLDQTASKLGEEVLRAVDFFNEHPQIDNRLPKEEAEEFNTITSFYTNNYGKDLFPKISVATRKFFDAALKNKNEKIKTQLPKFGSDVMLRYLTNSMSRLACFQKYPKANKIIFFTPLVLITGLVAMGVIGVAVGTTLTVAVLVTGVVYSTTKTNIKNIKKFTNQKLDTYGRCFSDSEIMDKVLSKTGGNLKSLKIANADTTALEKIIKELKHARDYYSDPKTTHRLA